MLRPAQESHRAQLAQCQQALIFIQLAFIILGFATLIIERNVLSSLDDFAFGLFFRAASRRLHRLIVGDTGRSAAAELADVLSSICDVHSYFAWVIWIQAGGIVVKKLLTRDRLATLLKASIGLELREEDEIGAPLFMDYLKNLRLFTLFGLLAAFAMAMHFGGLDYIHRRLRYYHKAASTGTFTTPKKAKSKVV